MEKLKSFHHHILDSICYQRAGLDSSDLSRMQRDELVASDFCFLKYVLRVQTILHEKKDLVKHRLGLLLITPTQEELESAPKEVQHTALDYAPLQSCFLRAFVAGSFR